MREIEFLKTVVCEGRKFEAGAVVGTEQVPADHLATCLRVGQARELTAARSALIERPKEVVVTVALPEELQAAIAEIERLREVLENRSKQLTAMAGERDAAQARVKELEAAAVQKVESATTTVVSSNVEPEHPPAPEPKPEEKPSGGAKPPVVGPSKPPELKGSKK